MRLALALVALTALPAGAVSPAGTPWDAARPAYRAAQSFTDGAYAALRRGLLSPVLPGRVSRAMAAPEADDSFDVFSARLRAREEALARAGDAGPSAQRSAVVDAFGSALNERYRLRLVGRSAESWARDPGAWHARELAPAALFGGALAFAAGLRADLPAAGLDWRLDLAPGARFLARSTDRRLARLAVSRPGSPLSLYTEWSARARVGASFSRRF
jgi:hypothetical protein